MIKYINNALVKSALCAGLLSASAFTASSALADEVYADASITSGIASVDTRAAQNYTNCVQADLSATHHSKALRACTNALKASAPSYAVKSNLLTRRGLLQLSSGRYDRAVYDFKMASRLNGENEYSSLGEGFAAIMKKDYAGAVAFFNDCANHDQAAPLALYGRAISKELSGDTQGAFADYKMAAKLRPDWAAPRTELGRFKALNATG